MLLDGPIAAALSLVDRAQAEPREVEAEARSLLETLEPSEAAAVAHWATGFALREMGLVDASRLHLEEGRAMAERLGLHSRAAEIGESLALTLFLLGDHRGALRQFDLAEVHLEGGRAARLQMQRGLILQRVGRTDEALQDFQRALAGMTQAEDRLGEARLRNNRCIIYAYRGDLTAARSDVERAFELAGELEHGALMAQCAHNLGFVTGRGGDVPAALGWYDEAAALYQRSGVEAGLAAVLMGDRAELLLEAGLSEEAAGLAGRAVTVLEETQNVADLAEAQLLEARALLADGRAEEALAAASAAVTGFGRQRRRMWTHLARYVAIQAEFAAARRAGEVPPGVLTRARRVARDLSAAGWRSESLHATVMAGRVALARGRAGTARVLLAEAQGARRSGTASARASAWHATALMRLVDGDRRGARRAVEAGMRVVESHRAGMGATELRAQAGIHGADLAELGLRIALDGDRPEEVLKWADRFRAVSMIPPEARPAASPRLAALLAELRRLSRAATEAALQGAPSRQLEAQRARLEEEVRRLVLQQGGTKEAASPRPLAGLSARLGERCLVEFFAVGGRFGAVVATASGGRMHLLEVPPQLPEWIAQVRFDLNRLAGGRSSAAARDATVASLAGLGGHIEEVLLGPLHLGDADLVIVPTGALHGLPWRVLPGLVDRAFVVAPSAASWLATRPAAGRDVARVFIAGPDLPAARDEVVSLARARGGRRLTGRSAKVAAVLGAIEASDIVHLAAHGSFRHDNPMFSSLRLSDGPLTVYELEQLSRVPSLFVLPACDAAVSGVRSGDELLGLSAALLRLGVSTLVAPIVPVSDAATRDLMLAFHRGVAGGERIDRALAAAGAALDDGDPTQHAVRRSFLVLGAS